MRTVVLDDDPTGTQSATNVPVLLECSTDLLVEILGDANSVYVQTNSRAITESAAVALVTRIRDEALVAGERLGEDIQFVLRGDSTLRGHVFAESAVFATSGSVLLFVPAFPDGGRFTRHGVHYARINGVDTPAGETEYADDPVFGFRNSVMTDYVVEKTGRSSTHVPLDDLRGGALVAVLLEASGVVTCDAVTAEDIETIGDAVRTARRGGRSIVVRSAAPLAANLAGVASRRLLPTPLVDGPGPTLLVCASHTAGATAQLRVLEPAFGVPVEIHTTRALADPLEAGRAAALELHARLGTDGYAMLSSQRERRAEHNTLDHGDRVMRAITTAVAAVRDEVDVVITKGGITSSEVASTGLGVQRATVLGQVLPGVSVWAIEPKPGHHQLLVVVPGNVGGEDTLQKVLAAVGRS